MSGIIILLLALLALACYGLYMLSRTVFCRLFPYKQKIAAYSAIFITFCFFLAMIPAAFGAVTQLRSQAYALGYAEADRPMIEAPAFDAQSYADAYTKGYTDAIEEYISENLAPYFSETPTAQDTSDELFVPPQEDPTTPDEPPIQDEPSETNDPAPPDTPIPTGTTVYYTRSGSVIHLDRGCSYLKNANEILSCDLASAPDRPRCSRCG